MVERLRRRVDNFGVSLVFGVLGLFAGATTGPQYAIWGFAGAFAVAFIVGQAVDEVRAERELRRQTAAEVQEVHERRRMQALEDLMKADLVKLDEIDTPRAKALELLQATDDLEAAIAQFRQVTLMPSEVQEAAFGQIARRPEATRPPGSRESS